ncbi:hypothetical protein MRX96_033203 [Rhipicephalus microplus]
MCAVDEPFFSVVFALRVTLDKHVQNTGTCRQLNLLHRSMFLLGKTGWLLNVYHLDWSVFILGSVNRLTGWLFNVYVLHQCLFLLGNRVNGVTGGLLNVYFLH